MQKYDYSYNMNGLADNPVCYFSVSLSVFLDLLNTRGGRTHALTVIKTLSRMRYCGLGNCNVNVTME